MTKIIAICGFIGSGKGTVADILAEEYAYTKVSFADTLKDSVAAVFGWPRHLLEGDTIESREWREQVDPWWANRLGMPHLTPRWVLQYWGTEVCRNGFHNDIWSAGVENRIRNTPFRIVIPDCRFPNEIGSVRRLGGEVWWVRRGPNPEWYACALKENQTSEDDHWMIHDRKETMEFRYPNIHASEWSWVGTEFNQVIKNDETLEDLKLNVKRILDPR